ncbi:hypothetical protein BC830DRAFT_1117399 [Chytriomyces sp. MP71]|nr:hypothetical protein BC830DRAFT_1117399 [Chytriomyces sp. MP71]
MGTEVEPLTSEGQAAAEMQAQPTGSAGQASGKTGAADPFQLKTIFAVARDGDAETSDVRILTQSANGPCPLLALANVLLLRGDVALRSDAPSIRFEALVDILGDLLVRRHAASPEFGDNVMEAITLIPTLMHGLDVNVTYDGGFDTTPALALFAAFGVPLCHGWIWSQQDALEGIYGSSEAISAAVSLSVPLDYNAAGGSSSSSTSSQPESSAIETGWRGVGGFEELKSYNQLVDAVVHGEVASMELSYMKDSAAQDLEIDALPVAMSVIELAVSEVPSERTPILEESASQETGFLPENNPVLFAQPELVSSQSDTLPESATQDNAPEVPDENLHEVAAADSTNEAPAVVLPEPADDAPVDVKGKGKEHSLPIRNYIDESKRRSLEKQVLLGQVAQSFLTSTSTQLTRAGLATLQAKTPPKSLAVLFRNNHFSTLFHHPQLGLFTLVADEGFLRKSCVWETLSLDGDGVFVDGGFGAYVASASDEGLNADVDLKGVDVAAQERAWKEIVEGRAGENDVAGLDTFDRDLALAMSLQEEENRAGQTPSSHSRVPSAQASTQQNEIRNFFQGQQRPSGSAQRQKKDDEGCVIQ